MTQTFQPGFDNAAGSYSPDNLIGGTAINIVTDSIVVASGQNTLARGSLLGKIATGAASAAADSGNTGDGTMGTITVGSTAKNGVYTLAITAEASNAGSFTLKDASNTLLGTGTVGQAFSAGGLSFTLADGTEDFDIGDTFTITVTAVPGQYVLSTSGASNGSQTPVAILAEDVDATSANVTTVAYLTGEFNTAAMTFGSAHTAASVKDGLRDLGIYLKTNLPA